MGLQLFKHLYVCRNTSLKLFKTASFASKCYFLASRSTIKTQSWWIYDVWVHITFLLYQHSVRYMFFMFKPPQTVFDFETRRALHLAPDTLTVKWRTVKRWRGELSWSKQICAELTAWNPHWRCRWVCIWKRLFVGSISLYTSTVNISMHNEDFDKVWSTRNTHE